jgi:uncharacterized protein
VSEPRALREPMVWLMIGLPAASVVAGLLLVATAVRSGGADEVTDEVKRTAQIQVSELGPDEQAQSMKLSAVLSIDQATAQVLPVNGEFVRNEALLLTLSHPTDSAQDIKLTLEPSELGWSSAAELESTHDWIAQLTPADGRWRLRGRIEIGQRAAHMGPALVGN